MSLHFSWELAMPDPHWLGAGVGRDAQEIQNSATYPRLIAIHFREPSPPTFAHLANQGGKFIIEDLHLLLFLVLLLLDRWVQLEV